MPWIKAIFIIFWRWIFKLYIWLFLIWILFGDEWVAASFFVYDLLCLAIIRAAYKPAAKEPFILLGVEVMLSIAVGIFLVVSHWA